MMDDHDPCLKCQKEIIVANNAEWVEWLEKYLSYYERQTDNGGYCTGREICIDEVIWQERKKELGSDLKKQLEEKK